MNYIESLVDTVGGDNKEQISLKLTAYLNEVGDIEEAIINLRTRILSHVARHDKSDGFPLNIGDHLCGIACTGLSEPFADIVRVIIATATVSEIEKAYD